MMKTSKNRPSFLKLALYGFITSLLSTSVFAIDWSKVEGKKVMLFSPGEMSWEYILTASKHSAAKSVKKGTNCLECHQGEQEKIGKLMGSGEKMEPAPVKGNTGSIPLTVKFVHDENNLYVNFQWKEMGQQANTDKDYQAKVAMMFSDGTVKSTKVAGCWGGCHVDAKGMPNSTEQLQLTKYIFKSRTKISRKGGGEHYKTQPQLQELINKGMFLELWRAELNPGQPAKGVSGYVLDKRHQDEKSFVVAESTYKDGVWNVTLSRALKAANNHQLTLQDGNTYYVGFSVHDGRTIGRHHHVSYGYKFTLDDGKADFVAKKQ